MFMRASERRVRDAVFRSRARRAAIIPRRSARRASILRVVVIVVVFVFVRHRSSETTIAIGTMTSTSTTTRVW